MNNRWPNRRNERGNLAEFGPALLLFFVFLLVPTLAIIRFGMYWTAMFLIVQNAAEKASKASSFDDAAVRASDTVHRLTDAPVVRLCGLTPGDVKRVQLYVSEHLTVTDKVVLLSREQLVLRRVLPDINTYDYEVHATFSLKPIFAGGALPALSHGLEKIPFLCSPASVTACAWRAVEYPDGLHVTATQRSTHREEQP